MSLTEIAITPNSTNPIPAAFELWGAGLARGAPSGVATDVWMALWVSLWKTTWALG